MNPLTFNSETITNELDVSLHAINQANNDCPKTTDKELDIYQQNIVEHIAAPLTSSRHSTLEKLNGLSSIRKNTESFMEVFTFDEILEKAKQKIRRFQVNWRDILLNASKEERTAYRNYKLFIYQNKLNREASYPDSNVFHWAFVVLALLLESIANSFFFATGSDIGLLGGLFQALFISIANIGTALLIGIYVLPYKNHVDSRKRFNAKAVTGIYLFCIYVFNLASAHYRALLEHDPFNAGIYAIPHLIENPLEINNFEAWNLLIIGMLFVFVTLVKGYKSDDTYPGYGEIDRKFKRACENCGKKRKEAIKAVTGIIDETAAEINALSRNVKQKIQDYKNSITQTENTVLNFNEYVSSAEKVCNDILLEYRNANTSVRNSKPPSYFSQRYAFNDKHFMQPVDLTREKTICDRFESVLPEIEIESRRLHEKIRQMDENAIDEIVGFSEDQSDENNS